MVLAMLLHHCGMPLLFCDILLMHVDQLHTQGPHKWRLSIEVLQLFAVLFSPSLDFQDLIQRRQCAVPLLP